MKNKNSLIKFILSLQIICPIVIIMIFNSQAEGMEELLIYLPIVTFVASLILQLLIQKKIIILSVTFIVYLIAPFVAGAYLNSASLSYINSTWLIFCSIYTFIALIGTFIADLVLIYIKMFTA